MTIETRQATRRSLEIENSNAILTQTTMPSTSDLPAQISASPATGPTTSLQESLVLSTSQEPTATSVTTTSVTTRNSALPTSAAIRSALSVNPDRSSQARHSLLARRDIYLQRLDTAALSGDMDAVEELAKKLDSCNLALNSVASSNPQPTPSVTSARSTLVDHPRNPFTKDASISRLPVWGNRSQSSDSWENLLIEIDSVCSTYGYDESLKPEILRHAVRNEFSLLEAVSDIINKPGNHHSWNKIRTEIRKTFTSLSELATKIRSTFPGTPNHAKSSFQIASDIARNRNFLESFGDVYAVSLLTQLPPDASNYALMRLSQDKQSHLTLSHLLTILGQFTPLAPHSGASVSKKTLVADYPSKGRQWCKHHQAYVAHSEAQCRLAKTAGNDSAGSFKSPASTYHPHQPSDPSLKQTGFKPFVAPPRQAVRNPAAMLAHPSPFMGMEHFVPLNEDQSSLFSPPPSSNPFGASSLQAATSPMSE